MQKAKSWSLPSQHDPPEVQKAESLVAGIKIYSAGLLSWHDPPAVQKDKFWSLPSQHDPAAVQKAESLGAWT